MKNYATKAAEPCAHITSQKQRVRQNGENVYLKNNTEFELEIFNPLQTTVLAKIKLNGNYISSNGLVLKPGQRVFLERYLNEARKFKFETYEVDGRSSEVKEAILNNGSVEVEFYLEYVQPISNPIWITTNNYPYNGNLNTFTKSSSNINTYYSNTNTIAGLGSYSTSSNITGSLTSNNNIRSISKSPQIKASLKSKSLKKMETGTVEKGGDSSQSFTTVDKTFNTWYSYKSSWKILPFSQKNIEMDEIKRYCPGCGTKVKKTSHKFCYNCGTKL